MGLAVLLVLLGTVVVRGLVVSVLWGWFVVPLGAHPIGIAWAYGLCILGVILTGATQETKRDPATSVPDALSSGIAFALVPLVLLGLGWLAHMGMR